MKRRNPVWYNFREEWGGVYERKSSTGEYEPASKIREDGLFPEEIDMKLYKYSQIKRIAVLLMVVWVVGLAVYSLFIGPGRHNISLWLYPVLATLVYTALHFGWDRYNFTQSIEADENGIVGPVFVNKVFYFSTFSRRNVSWREIKKVERSFEGASFGTISLKKGETAYSVAINGGAIVVFSHIERYEELCNLIDSHITL